MTTHKRRPSSRKRTREVRVHRRGETAFPVRLLCRTLQGSRAGFYAWQTRPPAPRQQADERLGVEIAAIHAESRQRYGSPRIHAELADRGCRMSRKCVARLMRVIWYNTAAT